MLFVVVLPLQAAAVPTIVTQDAVGPFIVLLVVVDGAVFAVIVAALALISYVIARGASGLRGDASGHVP